MTERILACRPDAPDAIEFVRLLDSGGIGGDLRRQGKSHMGRLEWL